MTRFDAAQTEAKLHYESGDYRVIRAGDFVRCAISGRPIPLDELRYWSAERQEAYYSPAEVLKAHGYRLGGRKEDGGQPA
ncbi:DUF2093 domain-containing protein [Camelimonas abortus]|uniref:DUF2093 domain-containing protein n=1 Tax=Camelimonas abortus TaxID=1017184 RepID=A0ABV7LG22_9HYPH